MGQGRRRRVGAQRRLRLVDGTGARAVSEPDLTDAPPEGMGGGAPDTDLESTMSRCARGSAVAFQLLYDATADSVYSLALRVTRSPSLAEDVTQDALVEVWRTAPRFSPAKGSARGWIMTIAHRRAVDKVRREESHKNRVAAAARQHQTPEQPHDVVIDALQGHWEQDRVRQALGDLTELQREAIHLAYFGGLTHVQVSESLGVPLGTAKTRLRDGLIRLRDSLGDAL